MRFVQWLAMPAGLAVAVGLAGAPAGATGVSHLQRSLAPGVLQHSPVAKVPVDINTLFDLPEGIGFDSSGYMYITDAVTPPQGSVTVYAPNASGNAAPVRTIAGSA